MPQPNYYIGIDTGGTFTDSAVVDENGVLVAIAKSSTAPADPTVGILNALSLAAEKLGLSRRELWQRCIGFVHGSTIATNAMLERKVAAITFSASCTSCAFPAIPAIPTIISLPSSRRCVTPGSVFSTEFAPSLDSHPESALPMNQFPVSPYPEQTVLTPSCPALRRFR
jgi:hypothetical protein